MSARRLVAAGLAAVTLLPSPVVAQSPDVAETSTRLRIVVSPPLAPLVDVYLDGEPVAGLTDVATGSVSGYAAIPAGAHQVELFPDGSDPSAGTPITSTPIDVADGDARTLAVAGDGSSMVLDDATVPPAIGASLRVVNLDTDAGPVDAWLGARPLALGLPPEAASMRFAVPAGTDDADHQCHGRPAVTVRERGRRTRRWFRDHRVHGADQRTGCLVPGRRREHDGRTRSIPRRGPRRARVADPAGLRVRTDDPVHDRWRDILDPADGKRPGPGAGIPAWRAGPLPLSRDDRGRSLTGWSLGPDGWTCVRHLAGDFDAFASGLTIRSAGAGRAAAADCGAFRCDPAVGARSGRFIAYGSSGSGGFEDPAAIDHGVPGTTACAYHRRYRSEGYTECRGVAARDGRRDVPRRTADGSVWLGFSRARSGDTVVGAVGIDCDSEGCSPHLIECKLRPEDRALCRQTLQVMLDPDRVRVPRVDASLACPGSVTLIRAGTGSAPPEDYRRARVVRTLRGDHDLVVDGVPRASLGAGGVYPRVCGGGPDRLWYRVRSVDGDRVAGWIAMPLVEPTGP